jgi:hypothetical protein
LYLESQNNLTGEKGGLPRLASGTIVEAARRRTGDWDCYTNKKDMDGELLCFERDTSNSNLESGQKIQEFLSKEGWQQGALFTVFMRFLG